MPPLMFADLGVDPVKQMSTPLHRDAKWVRWIHASDRPMAMQIVVLALLPPSVLQRRSAMPKTVPTAPLLDASAGSDKRIYVDADGRFVLQVQHRRCWKTTEVIPLQMLWRTRQWSLDTANSKPLQDGELRGGMFRAYLRRPTMQVDVKTGLLSITSAPDDTERIKAGVETDHKSTTVQKQRPQTMSSVTLASGGANQQFGISVRCE